jgi:DNA modification methylase
LNHREYTVDWNRLYQGDCIEGLRGIEPGSVDLVFADPPFNIGYEYDVYEDRCASEQYLHWTRAWGEAVHRALKPNGTFWLAIGDEYAAELKVIFQKDVGFSCRSWVVWYYTFGVNCTKKFSRSHTHLFHFVKDPKRFTFNAVPIRVPSARQMVYADGRANSGGRLPDDTWILRPQDLPNGFQSDEDMWYFSRVCGTFKERAGWHGCQMPEQLLGRIIRACSNLGDLVVDPFAGSGTTLAVAKKLGRRWIGFELSPNYVTRTRARLDAVQEGQPLEGAEEPTVSAPRTPSQRKEKPASDQCALASHRIDPTESERGIIEAFFAIRAGLSTDRVIADPELNDRFLQACRRLGLPGQPSEWNLRLMNLRKAGRLSGIPRSQKTLMSREEIDRYSFACEIAMEQLKKQARTLDSALCDPAQAADFDRYVRSMLAQDVSSFVIRWVALHIRKRRMWIKQAARELTAVQPLPKRSHMISALDWKALPESAGLYWLRSPGNKLYVGETLDLRQRFNSQFETSRFDFWGNDRDCLEVRYCELPNVQNALLKGNQSRWIAQWQPVGNYSELAAS